MEAGFTKSTDVVIQGLDGDEVLAAQSVVPRHPFGILRPAAIGCETSCLPDDLHRRLVDGLHSPIDDPLIGTGFGIADVTRLHVQ